MEEFSYLTFAQNAAIGSVLGLAYFSALWFTVRRLPFLRAPFVWMSISMLTRISLLVAGFYYLISPHWADMIAALIGLLLVRHVLVARIGPREFRHNAA